MNYEDGDREFVDLNMHHFRIMDSAGEPDLSPVSCRGRGPVHRVQGRQGARTKGARGAGGQGTGCKGSRALEGAGGRSQGGAR